MVYKYNGRIFYLRTSHNITVVHSRYIAHFSTCFTNIIFYEKYTFKRVYYTLLLVSDTIDSLLIIPSITIFSHLNKHNIICTVGILGTWNNTDHVNFLSCNSKCSFWSSCSWSEESKDTLVAAKEQVAPFLRFFLVPLFLLLVAFCCSVCA